MLLILLASAALLLLLHLALPRSPGTAVAQSGGEGPVLLSRVRSVLGSELPQARLRRSVRVSVPGTRFARDEWYLEVPDSVDVLRTVRALNHGLAGGEVRVASTEGVREGLVSVHVSSGSDIVLSLHLLSRP